jgi:ABC-type uncharacterized transport system substrate-binding protein
MMSPGSDPVEVGHVESLARPSANVTGLTNFNRDLGGKRLALLKEAVPKLARIAVLYDPATPRSVPEVKEVLPVAARTLGLNVHSWGVRAADDFVNRFGISIGRIEKLCHRQERLPNHRLEDADKPVSHPRGQA